MSSESPKTTGSSSAKKKSIIKKGSAGKSIESRANDAVPAVSLERKPEHGMNPVAILTGYYGARGERIKHIVHDGALKMPKDALNLLEDATRETGLSPTNSYDLPGLDCVVRPSLDPSLDSFVVTRILLERVSVPDPSFSLVEVPAPEGKMLHVIRTKIENRTFERRPVSTSAFSSTKDQAKIDRIRGGGGGEEAETNMDEDGFSPVPVVLLSNAHTHIDYSMDVDHKPADAPVDPVTEILSPGTTDSTVLEPSNSPRDAISAPLTASLTSPNEASAVGPSSSERPVPHASNKFSTTPALVQTNSSGFVQQAGTAAPTRAPECYTSHIALQKVQAAAMQADSQVLVTPTPGPASPSISTQAPCPAVQADAQALVTLATMPTSNSLSAQAPGPSMQGQAHTVSTPALGPTSTSFSTQALAPDTQADVHTPATPAPMTTSTSLSVQASGPAVQADSQAMLTPAPMPKSTTPSAQALAPGVQGKSQAMVTPALRPTSTSVSAHAPAPALQVDSQSQLTPAPRPSSATLSAHAQAPAVQGKSQAMVTPAPRPTSTSVSAHAPAPAMQVDSQSQLTPAPRPSSTSLSAHAQAPAVQGKSQAMVTPAPRPTSTSVSAHAPAPALQVDSQSQSTPAPRPSSTTLSAHAQAPAPMLASTSLSVQVEPIVSAAMSGTGVGDKDGPAPVPSSTPSKASTTNSESTPITTVQALITKPEPRWELHRPGPNDEMVTPGDQLTPKPAWYKKDSVADIERVMLPEWFDGSAMHRSPESYVKARETILTISDTISNRNVTSAMVRRSIVGDAGSLLRLRDFMSNWGLINEDAINDSAPTAPVLREKYPVPKEFTTQQRDRLVAAVVDQSFKRRKLAQDNSYTRIDWEKISLQVGHGATPSDCERNFLSMPINVEQSSVTAGTTDRSITPEISHETLNQPTKDALRQEFFRELVDSANPAVVCRATEAALEAINGSGKLKEAQSGALLGLVASRAMEEAKKTENQLESILSQLLDQRMKKLENRMVMMDDVESILEAEKMALELERRDLYTARCRHWFGGA